MCSHPTKKLISRNYLPRSWLDFTTQDMLTCFGEITIDKYGNFSIQYDNDDWGTFYSTGAIKITYGEATVKFSDGSLVTSGKIKRSRQAQNRWLINTWEGKTSWADVVIGEGLTKVDRVAGGGGF